MGDLPIPLPASHGRRRLHGFNVAPTNSKLLFAMRRVAPVFTTIESQCRSSVLLLSRTDDENGGAMVVAVA
jgi:hypothetical protein